jgi:DNA topoisomerase-1
LPKGENPLDVDFKRAQELIDEKAIADAVTSIKEKACRKVTAVLVLSSNGMDIYQCK